MNKQHARSRAYCWHRFSRKGYSAFCSIGREVAIGVLSVTTLAFATRAEATETRAVVDATTALRSSQGDGDAQTAATERQLDEIEVTADHQSITRGRQARLVAVIDRSQIEATPAATTSDLLKMVSGVDVRQRGPFGVQQDVTIDGGTQDQVTVLLNGVNITSPHTGHYSADWPVNIEEIERIEVLEGAASRVMGGSSLMGVINVVTRTDNRSNLTAGVQGGSYGSVGAQARGALVTGRWRNSLSGSWMRSDGGTANSSFARGQGFYRGDYDGSLFTLDWQAGASAMSHGANTFYSAAYPDQHDATTRIITSVAGATKTRLKVEPLVYWHRLYDHYQLIHNSHTGENYHRTDTWGWRLNLSYKWGTAGTTTAGAEMRHEKILSTNLGDPIEDGDLKHVPGDDSIFYTYNDARTNWSLQANHDIRVLGCLDLSAGLVAVNNTGLNTGWRVYPGIDASLTVDRSWRVYANFNESYRMPTFTDLYYKSVTHLGNRDLKPERLSTLQGGVVYSLPVVRTKASVFYHHGRNMMDWVMYTADDVYHAADFNLDNVGFTLSADAWLSQLGGVFKPFRSLSVSYTYIDQTRNDEVPIYKSNYAFEYLKHKFTAALTHTVWGPLWITWSLRWQDRMGSYIIYDRGQSTGDLHPYSPYAVLDVKVNCDITCQLRLWVDIANLTNHRYYDFGNIPQPGIWVMAGASVKL